MSEALDSQLKKGKSDSSCVHTPSCQVDAHSKRRENKTHGREATEALDGALPFLARFLLLVAHQRHATCGRRRRFVLARLLLLLLLLMMMIRSCCSLCLCCHLIVLALVVVLLLLDYVLRALLLLLLLTWHSRAEPDVPGIPQSMVMLLLILLLLLRCCCTRVL